MQGISRITASAEQHPTSVSKLLRGSQYSLTCSISSSSSSVLRETEVCSESSCI